MTRLAVLIYGVIAYALFFVTFLYAIGFVGNYVVPKSIDSGATAPFTISLVVNLALMSLFAIQHSVMARPGFKRWWTRIVPPSMERSTYVLLSSLVLALLFWLWRPMPGVVWQVEGVAAMALTALFFLGWGVVLINSYAIDHFELFGLRQVFDFFRGRSFEPPGFKENLLYKLVRHPLMLGFIIAFWATPVMSVGHLLFAVVTTAYILVALQFEERDLIGYLGGRYRDYQQRVPMLIPFVKFPFGGGSSGGARERSGASSDTAAE
ncbi:hypothetical protein DDZ18_09185 [Marinicauda salina]|uniref:methanethiol S-methyltransferase n=1 Tax=Marinicauda salina TaxID=2135793 RepID=A0A2U2BUY5_9PROT|nr:methanethiol S-methyltransferase [Marinicauda salina]PWE17812.1 hypothetical protein DDZ18_09185 [Marinicauda salina]